MRNMVLVQHIFQMMWLSIAFQVMLQVIPCPLQRSIWDIVQMFYKVIISHHLHHNLKIPLYGIFGGIDLLKRKPHLIPLFSLCLAPNAG